MKLTNRQKLILDDCYTNFSIDDIVYDDSVNAYILVCLAAIKDYKELKTDVIKYMNKKVGELNAN